MKQFLRIDEEGYYIEPVIVKPEIVNGESVYEVSDNLIEERYTEPLYKPRWTGTGWVEGLTQEELEERERLKREELEEHSSPTIEELSAKLEEQDAINQQLAQQLVDLEIKQMLGGY